MSIIELEAQKASLAREILTVTDESIVRDLWLFLKRLKSTQTVHEKRKIGILNKKVTFSEIGDGKMTTEEFLGL
jgi:hypothetical protein